MKAIYRYFTALIERITQSAAERAVSSKRPFSRWRSCVGTQLRAVVSDHDDVFFSSL